MILPWKKIKEENQRLKNQLNRLRTELVIALEKRGQGRDKQIAEEARCRTIDELLVVLEKEIPEQQMLLGRLKRKFWKYQTRVSSQE